MRPTDKAAPRSPTLEDVAALAGVSRALASLALRGSPKVSDARRTRVLNAATELGYRPNAIARSLASPRTQTIGILLQDLHNPFYAEIMDGIEVAAAEAGYQLLLGSSRLDKEQEAKALDRLLEYRVDATVVVGSLLEASALATIARARPMVSVSRSFRSIGADSVVCDEPAGARLAVEHLISLGHKRIAHLAGGSGPGAADRQRGYELAMQTAGLEPIVVPGDFSREGGARAARELLAMRARPSGVFAANDLAAVGAIEEFDRAGVAVPGEISLVGYDNTFLAGLSRLDLTSVNQPRLAMGSLAVQLLVERLGGRARNKHGVLKPELVVRGSTAPLQ